MSEEAEKNVNMESENREEQGLDQDKFADLFSSLDEEAVMAMMERAGLSDEDVDAAAAEEPEESAGTVPDTASDKEAMLSPEHIGHILSVLGDDIIGDMLESAGLTDEDVDAALAEAQADLEQDGSSGGKAAEAPPDSVRPKKSRRRRRGKNIRRLLFVLIFIGIILLVFAVNKIYNSVTINTNAPIQYSEPTDEISADEGSLHVNNVSVSVPTDGTEEYSISYAWAENDEQYPSVPHAITAIYSGKPEESAEAGKESTEAEAKAETDAESDAEAGTEAAAESEKLYSISLYRNETVPSENVKKGKKASNWFDDWKVVNEGDVLQIPLKSGSINGFYIFPQPPEEDEEPSDYNDFSYYFAVKDDKGISTYVIEGVCLDPERDAEFRSIMENCIHSITIE